MTNLSEDGRDTNIYAMDAAESKLIVLNADPEHSGVRIAVMSTMAATFIIVFVSLIFIIRSLEGSIVSDFYFVLSCIGALPTSLAVAGLVEYIAKRRLLSGRSIQLSEEGMIAITGPEEKAYFHWDGRMTLLKWYFQLSGYRRGGRERRIPAGWFCVCCQVQQDENRFVAFSYFPDERAKEYIEEQQFVELRPGEFERSSIMRRMLSPPNRPEIPTKVLAGKYGTHWLAEKRRWSEGLELTMSDFSALYEVLEKRVID